MTTVPDNIEQLSMDSINALIQICHAGNAAERCLALRGLAQLDAEQAVLDIGARLRDEDIDVCIDAAAALGSIGTIDALPSLLESLHNDPEPEIKTAVVTALGQIHSEQVAEVLTKIAAQRPDNLDYGPGDDWDPWWDMQLAAVRALARFEYEPAIAVLMGLLDDEDGQDIDSEIMAALASMGADGEAAVIKLLHHQTPRRRRLAARALRHGQSVSSLHALGQGLLDHSPEVRVAVLRALAERRAEYYIKSVLLMLRDNAAEVRTAALQAIERLALQITDIDALCAELLPLLEVSEAAIRAQTLRLLTGYSDQLSKPALGRILRLLKESDTDVVAAACSVLGAAGEQRALPRLLTILSETRREAKVRQSATQALGNYGIWNEAIMNGLLTALTDTDQVIQTAALQALLALEQNAMITEDDAQLPKPLDLVIAVLQGQIIPAPENLSPATITPLAEAKDVEPVQHEASAPTSTLEAIARDSATAVTTTATATDITVITQDEDQLDDYLQIVERNQAIGDWLQKRISRLPHINVRRTAAQLLATRDEPHAVTALLDTLQKTDDADLYCAVLSALAVSAKRGMHSPNWQTVRPLLYDNLTAADQDCRVLAMRILGELAWPGDSERLLTLLNALLDDNEAVVRSEAARALANLSKTANPTELTTILESLSELLLDNETTVALSAVDNLVTILQHHSLPKELNKFSQFNKLHDALAVRIIEAATRQMYPDNARWATALYAVDPQNAVTRLLLLTNQSDHGNTYRQTAILLLAAMVALLRAESVSG